MCVFVHGMMMLNHAYMGETRRLVDDADAAIAVAAAFCFLSVNSYGPRSSTIHHQSKSMIRVCINMKKRYHIPPGAK